MCSFCVCIPQLAETQDGESAFGSDSSSVLEWKPPETLSSKPPRPRPIPAQPTPTIRKALSALNIQVKETEHKTARWLRTGMSTVNWENFPSFKLSTVSYICYTVLYFTFKPHYLPATKIDRLLVIAHSNIVHISTCHRQTESEGGQREGGSYLPARIFFLPFFTLRAEMLLTIKHAQVYILVYFITCPALCPSFPKIQRLQPRLKLDPLSVSRHTRRNVSQIDLFHVSIW